jgi:hypothetical protein
MEALQRLSQLKRLPKLAFRSNLAANDDATRVFGKGQARDETAHDGADTRPTSSQ